MDTLERERLLVVVSSIVRSYMFDEEGESQFSLRGFADLLNSGHRIPELRVTYQTVKNWIDGVHLPKQSWLEGIEDEANSDSVVFAMAQEISSALWTTRSL